MASDIFTCGICTEAYDNKRRKAKFLACHHTFCSYCLSQWQNKKGQANTSRIRCPNCNTLTDVPKNGIDGLQTNFYIENMKDISKEATKSKPRGNKHRPNRTRFVKQSQCEKQNGCHGFIICLFIICFFSVCVIVCILICNYTLSVQRELAGHDRNGIEEENDVRHTLEDQLLKSHAALTEILGAIHKIESEVQTIQDKNDSVTEDCVAFSQFAQHQLEKWLQETTNTIYRYHATQIGKLLDKHRKLQQVAGLLERYINESKHTTKTDDDFHVISCAEKLEKATQITKVELDQNGSCIKSELMSNSDLLNESVYNIGQTPFKSILPTSVTFRNNTIPAGIETIITLNMFNAAGNKFSCAPSFLTVQITDPQQQELTVTLDKTHPSGTVIFTPQVRGRHEISIICLGQKLKSEQTHIMVYEEERYGMFSFVLFSLVLMLFLLCISK